MTSYLFIAGACHGGWCWELIEPLLQQRGHETRAIDLPGMGGDRPRYADVSLNLWARSAADAALTLPAPRVVVAHSRGGIVASQASELLGEECAGSIYIAALLVPDGVSGFEAAAWSGAPAIAANIAVDGASMSLDRAVARDRLYNRTPEELAEHALDRLEPEPLAPLAQKLVLSKARYGVVPRTFLACARDNSTIDAKLRGEMLSRSPCEMVRVIDADHSPFYSAPADLVEAILAAPLRI